MAHTGLSLLCLSSCASFFPQPSCPAQLPPRPLSCCFSRGASASRPLPRTCSGLGGPLLGPSLFCLCPCSEGPTGLGQGFSSAKEEPGLVNVFRVFCAQSQGLGGLSRVCGVPLGTPAAFLWRFAGLVSTHVLTTDSGGTRASDPGLGEAACSHHGEQMPTRFRGITPHPGGLLVPGVEAGGSLVSAWYIESALQHPPGRAHSAPGFHGDVSLPSDYSSQGL